MASETAAKTAEYPLGGCWDSSLISVMPNSRLPQCLCRDTTRSLAPTEPILIYFFPWESRPTATPLLSILARR